MATSKLMASSTSATTSSRNSDLRRNSLSKPDFNNIRNHHHQISQNASAAVVPSPVPMSTRESTLLNAEITVLDAAGAIEPITDVPAPVRKKTVDDVWREIVAGKKAAASEPPRRVEPKEEAMDEMMTLEDFLVKAGAVEESAVAAATAVEGEVKVEPVAAVAGTSGGMFAFESPYMARQGSVESGGGMGYGSGGGLEAMGSGGIGDGLRRKRTASNLLEPMDKAAQQRQRRMIKNRESAARSRERKQAYQVELEAMAVRLEEENEQLLKEKTERTKERCKLLMEKVIPVVEKRRPTRILRRVRSMSW